MSPSAVACQPVPTLKVVTISELEVQAPDPLRPETSHYRLTLAANAADVQAAQRLRHQVFAQEQGARTAGANGLDVDEFDEYCDHLIVWHHAATAPRRAVATYRMLPPHSNDLTPRRAGLYSQTEFDLTPLEGLLDQTVEAGRSCVSPDHRTGTAVALLWGGIARYMHLTGYRYLVGCASIPIDDGGGNAAAFWDLAQTKHMVDGRRRCTPRHPFDTRVPRPARPVIPPLLKGYLRLGAQVCGPPALDPDFGCADFLVLLDLDGADPRYLRYFLGQAA